MIMSQYMPATRCQGLQWLMNLYCHFCMLIGFLYAFKKQALCRCGSSNAKLNTGKIFSRFGGIHKN